jgi:hypothetical protein
MMMMMIVMHLLKCLTTALKKRQLQEIPEKNKGYENRIISTANTKKE